MLSSSLHPTPHPRTPTGFRMYKQTPVAALPDGGGGSTGEAAPEAAAAAKPEQAGQESGPGAVKEEEQQAEDSGDESDAAGTKPSREQRLRAYRLPPDPQQLGRWELVASTLEEFEVRGRWLVRSGWVG